MTEDKHSEYVENTSIINISFIQNLIAVVPFCRGKPVKENISKNNLLYFILL